jgi:hypothetical protein
MRATKMKLLLEAIKYFWGSFQFFNDFFVAFNSFKIQAHEVFALTYPKFICCNEQEISMET